MNKDIKKLWVDALLSGEYKQGFRSLKNQNDQFCCLGVLCDVHQKLHPENVWVKDDKVLSINYSYMKHKASIPAKVKKWSALQSDVIFDIAGIKDNLISHNDIHQHTFELIGNAINEQL